MDQAHLLTVDEILRKANTGMTEPYLCVLSDNNKYYVKGRSNLIKGCISEVICAELGKNFGLPIPEYSIADVDDELIRYDLEAKATLGVGNWFASRLQENITEVKISDLKRFNEDTLRRVFLFDAWIKNEDRTGTELGGNPNLFFSTLDDSLIVIDHNQAFDTNFDIDDLKKLHICREYWFSNPQDILLRETFEPQMQIALEKMQGYEHILPEGWRQEEPEFLDLVDDTLQSYNTDAFWEPITWAR